jgi:16S rRNA (uracil1498-N3)-methyltransferase
LIRLFLDADLKPATRLALSPEQGHYLVRVMRQGLDAPVLVFNGRDGEWRARLAEIGKRGCELVTDARVRPQAGPPDLELVVAMVKRPRLETIVEKAAELGVRRVRLALTARTNADRANLTRLRAIAIEASEQTGRLEVPDILQAEPLGRILEDLGPARRLMFCDEAGAVAAPTDALRAGVRHGLY